MSMSYPLSWQSCPLCTLRGKIFVSFKLALVSGSDAPCNLFHPVL